MKNPIPALTINAYINKKKLTICNGSVIESFKDNTVTLEVYDNPNDIKLGDNIEIREEEEVIFAGEIIEKNIRFSPSEFLYTVIEFKIKKI